MFMNDAGCFDIANISNHLGTAWFSEQRNNYTEDSPYPSHCSTMNVFLGGFDHVPVRWNVIIRFRS